MGSKPFPFHFVMAAGKVIGVFLQESFGSFMLLVLLFPFGSFLGDSWSGWIQHFFCVMLHDYITGGSQVNPSVSVATFFYGWNDFQTMVVRIIGQMCGGIVAFPIIAKVLPAYIEMGGPTLADDAEVKEGAMWEFGLTFVLLLLVYVSVTQIGLPTQRPCIAAGIRGLICAGARTGPAMNPMIAVSWAYFAVPNFFTSDFAFVYLLAPTAGAVLATKVWQAIEPKKVVEKKKKKA